MRVLLKKGSWAEFKNSLQHFGTLAWSVAALGLFRPSLWLDRVCEKVLEADLAVQVRSLVC